MKSENVWRRISFDPNRARIDRCEHYPTVLEYHLRPRLAKSILSGRKPSIFLILRNRKFNISFAWQRNKALEFINIEPEARIGDKSFAFITKQVSELLMRAEGLHECDEHEVRHTTWKGEKEKGFNQVFMTLAMLVDRLGSPEADCA